MEGLKNLSKEQLHKILAALVLSDGHLYKHKGKPRSIRLSTSHFGEDQHRLFRYLCYELFGKDIKTRKSTAPSSKQRLLISTFNSVKFVPTLYSLCPEYNTTPGKLSKAEFLKIPQPNLQFILNETKELQWLFLRTYFDFDGSISPSIKLKHKLDKKGQRVYEYYQVQFECEIKISETNPSLVKDLILLCTQLGLSAKMKRDNRNWSEISGICITQRESVRKFLDQGGPITKVKVSGKSNRFKGISKIKICKFLNKLIQDEKIIWSKSFSNKNDALEYQEKVNKFLVKLIKKE